MDGCQYEHEFNERLVMVEERSKSNTHRLDKVEKEQELLHSISESLIGLNKNQEHLTEKVDGIKKDVETMKAVPGKRWEQVIDKVLFAAAGTGIGAIVSLIVARVLG